jgi:hypothetical protein
MSTLTVQTLQAPTSGANANKVLIPSGHTLDASAGTLVPSAGAVMQVVESARTPWTNTASTNYTNTGHSVTITPSATSSKILLTGNLNGTYTSDAATMFQIKLYKGGSDIAWIASNYGQGLVQVGESFAWSYLDSPSTTSATTYTLYFRAQGGGTVGLQNYLNTAGNNTSRSNIIAMEIAA